MSVGPATSAPGHSLPILPDNWIAGVDLGRAQGVVDAPAIVSAGISFAWVRLADGLHDIDPQAHATARACLDAGLPFGWYGVIEPYGAEHAEQQARHFLDAMGSDSGATLPPACDFELGKGRSATDLFASAERWCDVVGEADRAPILYAGPAFLLQLEQLGGDPARAMVARLASRPLWVAHYTGSLAKPPRVPAPWQDWAVWQVSGDGGVSLPGGRGWVDLDVFRGSVDDLAALGWDARDTLESGAVAAEASHSGPRYLSPISSAPTHPSSTRFVISSTHALPFHLTFLSSLLTVSLPSDPSGALPSLTSSGVTRWPPAMTERASTGGALEE